MPALAPSLTPSTAHLLLCCRQRVSTGQKADAWANCHRYDASFVVTDFPAITGAVSAYRQLAQPGVEDLS